MTRRQWVMALGTGCSLLLLIYLYRKLDWPTFWIAIQQVSWAWLILAGAITAAGTLLRALRWNLIAGEPVDQFRFFCHATNLGYLGNAILPARAGEALRMFSISRATHLPVSKAVTSAVLDRIADFGMLGIVMILVAAKHGTQVLSWEASWGIAGGISLSFIGVLLFMLKGEGYQPTVAAFAQRLPTALGTRLTQWYSDAHDGLWPLRSGWRMSSVFALNLGATLADYAAMWIVILAFGWSLSQWAAVTVGVFIAASTSLPSAPGYVGVYQAASMLALGLYGVDGASAVAYAVVLQLVNLSVIILLSLLSALDSRVCSSRRAKQAVISDAGCGRIDRG